jgi:hypothetical protein
MEMAKDQLLYLIKLACRHINGRVSQGSVSPASGSISACGETVVLPGHSSSSRHISHVSVRPSRSAQVCAPLREADGG